MFEPTRLKGPNAEKIQSMFASVAENYDRANTVLSGGIHHLWRKKLVKLSGAKEGDSVLDCATGTGDLALEFSRTVGPSGHVVGTDFCDEMIQFAPAKAKSEDLEIQFRTADVTKLPFNDNSFDFSSISFGIRNVDDPLKGLMELVRVVKPGGKVIVLEFGQPIIPGFRAAYNFYSQRVLPTIGGWVTGQKGAYQYLQDSSSNFPCRDDFVRLMDETNRFEKIEYKTLSGGIAYIYIGTKLSHTGVRPGGHS